MFGYLAPFFCAETDQLDVYMPHTEEPQLKTVDISEGGPSKGDYFKILHKGPQARRQNGWGSLKGVQGSFYVGYEIGIKL